MTPSHFEPIFLKYNAYPSTIVESTFKKNFMETYSLYLFPTRIPKMNGKSLQSQKPKNFHHLERIQESCRLENLYEKLHHQH